LTRGANQGHIEIIADIVEPAPETAAGFFMSQDNPGAVSIYRNRFAEFSAIGRPLENGLTCRANHRHNAIIAKIAKARTEKSVAGFLFGILESDGGRTSTPQLPTPPARASRACRRPNLNRIGRHARTCRPAARIVTAARGPRRDKVRAPNDLRTHSDHAARFYFLERCR
jgi:hypothetical protein